MKYVFLLLVAALIAGCGTSETAATAAAVAAGKAQEAKDAKNVEQRVVQQLNAANQLEAQRLKEAEQQANQ